MTSVLTKTARRETGGPPHCGNLAIDRSGADIEARVIALEVLTTADLQIEWRRLYHATPPTRLSRDLLIRGVAYRVQEHAHGGLSPGTRRRLQSLAEASGQLRRVAVAATITLRPGTKLVREWHGQVHTVDVLDDGFEYRGECYRSLTRIARRITGTQWSGPLFFGIGKRRRVVDGVAGD